jgi:cathepsin A (carboxypeptidase C)
MSSSARPLPVLNFKSVLIGNGLSQPDIQFASVPEYACDSEYAVYEDPQGSECTSLRSKMNRCESLAKSCFKYVPSLPCIG